jgi:hypothetical protein
MFEYPMSAADHIGYGAFDREFFRRDLGHYARGNLLTCATAARGPRLGHHELFYLSFGFVVQLDVNPARQAENY